MITPRAIDEIEQSSLHQKDNRQSFEDHIDIKFVV